MTDNRRPPRPALRTEPHPVATSSRRREKNYAPPKSSPLRQSTTYSELIHTSTTAAAIPDGVDEATANAILEVLNEHGTRRSRQSARRAPPADFDDTMDIDQPVEAATPVAPEEDTPVTEALSVNTETQTAIDTPSAASAEAPSTSTPQRAPPKVTKKGVAKKPPAAKKRKTDSGAPTPTSPAPSTPITADAPAPAPKSKKKKTSKSKKPAQSATAALIEDADNASDAASTDSVEDPNVVYCICRKPDNHTWMIGCDGGCDGWFHGDCVGRKKEEEPLIDRYICPNCVAAGIGVTTWKPMCRRPGCYNPARLKKGQHSKYCSDDCGIAFFRGEMSKVGHVDGKGKPARSKKKQTSIERDEEDVEMQDPLGGQISLPILKSLVHAVPNANEFRRLGSPEARTPPTSRPGTSNGETKKEDAQASFTSHESIRLSEISEQKSRLRESRMRLNQRGDFLRLARDRATRLKEREGKNTICGYDSRLAWDDVTFAEWFASADGKSAVERSTLSPPPDAPADEDAMDVDGAPSQYKVCERKNCGRHTGWWKLALHDNRHDAQLVREEMEAVMKEEQEIRTAAEARKGSLEEKAADDEGWAEVVED